MQPLSGISNSFIIAFAIIGIMGLAQEAKAQFPLLGSHYSLEITDQKLVGGGVRGGLISNFKQAEISFDYRLYLWIKFGTIANKVNLNLLAEGGKRFNLNTKAGGQQYFGAFINSTYPINNKSGIYLNIGINKNQSIDWIPGEFWQSIEKDLEGLPQFIEAQVGWYYRLPPRNKTIRQTVRLEILQNFGL